MKKLVLVALVAGFLVSCKKDYTCQCNAGGITLSNNSIGKLTKKMPIKLVTEAIMLLWVSSVPPLKNKDFQIRLLSRAFSPAFFIMFEPYQPHHDSYTHI